MTTYYRQQLITALNNNSFDGKVASVPSGDKWQLKQCYIKALDLPVINADISNVPLTTDDFESPSNTPAVPVLLAWYGQLLFVLDGLHRIASYRKHNINTVPAYILPEPILMKCKI